MQESSLYGVDVKPTTAVVVELNPTWRQCRKNPSLSWVVDHWGVAELLCSANSHVRLFSMPWTAARQGFLSLTISQSLLKRTSIESVMPSNHLILCLLLLLLPSIFPSIRVFSNESALSIRWPEYWSFSFSISPLPLISFRTDWFDLLAVPWTLKSLLLYRSSLEFPPAPACRPSWRWDPRKPSDLCVLVSHNVKAGVGGRGGQVNYFLPFSLVPSRVR